MNISKLFTDKIKIPLFKLSDRLNGLHYPYLPPDPITYDHEAIEKFEAEVYKDILNRITPDGVFCYRWDVKKQAEEGILFPDMGDMGLFQGIALASLCLKAKNGKDGGVTFKTLNVVKILLRGCERFITDDGYLLRGFTDFYKKIDDEWVRIVRQYPKHDVSGDQLAGLCLGLSMTWKYFPQLFSDTLIRKILSFADRMIDNGMMLEDFRTGKTCKSEMSYKNPFILEGHVTTKLALLSLAHKIDESGKKVGDTLRYYGMYCKLIFEYSFDKLAEYSSLFLWRRNNFFGTHINAIALYTIGLNMDFPEYAIRGLTRISYQTRHWGYGIYGLLANFRGQHDVQNALMSYITDKYTDVFKRTIWSFGRKIRIKPIPIRARNYTDYFIQRPPYDNSPYAQPNNKNPDIWLWKEWNSSRLDFFFLKQLAEDKGVI